MRCCSPCTRPAGAGPPSMPATPIRRRRVRRQPTRALIDRRTRREPIAYITGVQEFWNRDFAVSPAVLIPRPETELIIEEALSCVFGLAADIGTGSGCLAVTLAAEFPRARFVATDISAAALGVARANAARHNVAGPNRVPRDSLPRRRRRPVRPDRLEPAVRDRCRVRGSLAPEVRMRAAGRRWRLDPTVSTTSAACCAAAGAHLAPGGRLLLEIGHGQRRGPRSHGACCSRACKHLRLLDIRNDLQRHLRAWRSLEHVRCTVAL